MTYSLVPHKEVNAHLRHGWILYGNPVSSGSVIWQAMTKTIADEDAL